MPNLLAGEVTPELLEMLFGSGFYQGRQQGFNNINTANTAELAQDKMNMMRSQMRWERNKDIFDMIGKSSGAWTVGGEGKGEGPGRTGGVFGEGGVFSTLTDPFLDFLFGPVGKE